MLFAAVLLGGLSPAAVTLNGSDQPVTTVSAAGLDLTQPAHVRRFTRRVQTAVNRVCAVSGRTLHELAWRRQCMDEAAESARPQVKQLLAVRGVPGQRIAGR